jgi:hypothetical protein
MPNGARISTSVRIQTRTVTPRRWVRPSVEDSGRHSIRYSLLQSLCRFTHQEDRSANAAARAWPGHHRGHRRQAATGCCQRALVEARGSHRLCLSVARGRHRHRRRGLPLNEARKPARGSAGRLFAASCALIARAISAPPASANMFANGAGIPPLTGGASLGVPACFHDLLTQFARRHRRPHLARDDDLGALRAASIRLTPGLHQLPGNGYHPRSRKPGAAADQPCARVNYDASRRQRTRQFDGQAGGAYRDWSTAGCSVDYNRSSPATPPESLDTVTPALEGGRWCRYVSTKRASPINAKTAKVHPPPKIKRGSV